MKIIKKIFLVITFTTIFSVSAFAKSGFEFLIDFQFGLGVGVPTKTMEKENEFKGDIGFDGTAYYSILGKTNMIEISTADISTNSVSVIRFILSTKLL